MRRFALTGSTDMARTEEEGITLIAIEKYLTGIYDDFLEYLEGADRLCALKGLSFQAGRTPDYSDIHIQQLYLLRYAFCYAYEYKQMYSTLFARERFTDTIEVTSIGCGNMIDYWSLAEAFEEMGDDCKIIYRGVDLADWNYRIQARAQDSVDFQCGNVSDVISVANRLASNVYFFPKSISEFSGDEFDTICGQFANLEIERDRVHILISLRIQERSLEMDKERSARLVAAMEHNGFVTEDDPQWEIRMKDMEAGIRKLDRNFVYPDGAKALLENLNKQCKSYICNGKNCEADCLHLNRQPALTAKNIRFQVLSFARKEQE